MIIVLSINEIQFDFCPKQRGTLQYDTLQLRDKYNKSSSTLRNLHPSRASRYYSTRRSLYKYISCYPSYQWYNQKGIAIANKCETHLSIGPIAQKDFGFYRLSIIDQITNERVLTRWVEVKQENSRISHNTNQMIQPYTDNRTTPQRIIQPQGGIFRKGANINLTAHIENASYYQWYKDGTRLDGCTGNTLIITNAVLANSGTYTLLASNEHNLTIQTQVGVVIN